MKLILTLCALSLPLASFAEGAVSTKIDVFVEKTVPSNDGTTKLLLQEPKVVVPGDRVVYVLSYHNTSAQPATNFTITDPVPGPILFDGTPDSTALVSVDGGKTWGDLATLKVTKNGLLRGARPSDVTDVRWALKSAIPAGAIGKLSFRGTVR